MINEIANRILEVKEPFIVIGDCQSPRSFEVYSTEGIDHEVLVEALSGIAENSDDICFEPLQYGEKWKLEMNDDSIRSIRIVTESNIVWEGSAPKEGE